jgi:hypothetical protein
MVVFHRSQPHNAHSRLQIGVALLFVMLGSFFPDVVFAQAPQPVALSVDRNSLPQGACYILTAENGANVILDVQYTFNNGPVQTVRGWPKLDDTGRAQVCTDSATVIGSYAFVAMRNTLNAEWVPVQVPIAVTPPLQPNFLSVSPNTVSQGSCYVVFVENGADMTLDLQYAFNDGSAQTLRGWPKLDSGGRAYVCASPATAIGNYSFLAFRNTLNTDWVPVQVTVAAKAPHPVSRTQLASDPVPEVIKRALAVHGDGWITGRIVDSVSEGTLTWYTVDGPDPAFNMKLLAKGLRKVQRIIREPGADLRQGTDGTQTWSALSIGFWTSAAGQALQFIESQTVRSIQHLFNYQAEGLVLRDLGVNNDARVIEAEDRDGRRTSYFIDVMTSRITRLEFVVGESKDPFSGRPTPNVDTSIFSDFRVVQGMLTPFKIERYINNFKHEDTQFASVRYNASVPDDAFRPLP